MPTIGEYFESTLVRGINEGVGNAGVVQSMHGTPADGTLELPTGARGPVGDQGPDAYPFRWEGDIADSAALAALTPDLRPVHAGKAWRVESTDALMIWNGSAFDSFPDAFGGHGADGDPNTLTLGDVATGAVGGELEVTISGTPPNQTIDLLVPQGIQGQKGPLGVPGPLRNSSDYDNTVTHVDGMVPLWDDEDSKWTPSPYPGWRGPWTIYETQAWDGSSGFTANQSNVSTSPNTVATIAIPAQDVDWRPVVFGGVFTGPGADNGTVRIDFEVRIGSNAGQIVACGTGLAYNYFWRNVLQPFYATSAMTPSSSVGVISAGASTTLYLVLRRTLGSGNYSYDRTASSVAVWAVPVTGAPS